MRRAKNSVCAVGSVVEHRLHTAGVTGSNPVPRTTPPKKQPSGCFFLLPENRRRRRQHMHLQSQKDQRISLFSAVGTSMTRSVARTASVRWNISVPRDLDEDARIFLDSGIGKEGSLSAPVRKAVSLHIMSSLTAEAKKKVRAAGLSQQELDKTIAQAIAWTINQIAN